jgi:hypothetical protein
VRVLALYKPVEFDECHLVPSYLPLLCGVLRGAEHPPLHRRQ